MEEDAGQIMCADACKNWTWMIKIYKNGASISLEKRAFSPFAEECPTLNVLSYVLSTSTELMPISQNNVRYIYQSNLFIYCHKSKSELEIFILVIVDRDIFVVNVPINMYIGIIYNSSMPYLLNNRSTKT